MPDTYSHGHHESVLRSHAWRTAANSAHYLLEDLRSGQRLLDVRCGPGTVTIDLAIHVSPGLVVGIDAHQPPGLGIGPGSPGRHNGAPVGFLGDAKSGGVP